MIYDFHTLTYLSDGELSPLEFIRRAYVIGYRAIAVTDHVAFEDQERVIKILVAECRRASEQWGILALPGVEITHVPKNLINTAAEKAKDLGAQVVLVHGETIVEPVEAGSNLAVVSSQHVHILAHPGLITGEEALTAKENNLFLELSARAGHSITNGHLAKTGLSAGAHFLLDSDPHGPSDLLITKVARQVILGSGLSEDEMIAIMEDHPKVMIGRTR